MAQYNAIKAAVNAYIKANGRKEITGQILNSVLNATIDSLGRFFQFAGEARPDTDPGTPDQNVTYLAGVPGTYTNFGGLVVDEQEIALLMWNGSWVKHTMLIGIREVTASVDNQVGTPSVDVNYEDAELSLEFHNIKGDPGQDGEDGAAAGFGSVTADVDANIGTPGVSVVTSGADTAKNFTFHFTNLKGQKGETGEPGVTSVNVAVDNNTGVPSATASLSGGVLTINFQNLKGQQGDTGSSVDYPYTLVNNVTTDDATQGLSAAMGVYLQDELTQLEHEVHNLSGKYYGVFPTSGDLPDDATTPGYAFVGAENPYAIWNFDGEEWSDSGSVANGIYGEPGVGFDSAWSLEDGTFVIVLTSGDTITFDLNHNHPNYFDKLVGSTIPAGGLVPDVAYKLGTLTGAVTITLASAVSGCLNHYFFTFDTSASAPTITFPVSVTKWDGNCVTSNAPVISASKHYEVSILDGVGFIYES